MSDLCMYELEDITWDDVCQCDDHIVPLLGDEQASEHLFQDNSHKKTRQEVICVASDTGGPFAVEAISQEQETLAPYDRWNKMLAEEGWSQKSDGISSYGRESMKEVSSLASDDTRDTGHCIDSMLNDKSAAVGISFGYSLDHMSEADNNLGFFSNNHEDNDSNLYYGWPDTGTFEDFDQMFRSSAFELGARNEDDLGWFSSSGAIGGSDNAFSYLDSNSQKTIGESHDASRPNGVGGPIEKSTMQNSSVIYKDNFWPSVDDESVSLDHLPASNVSNGSESNDGVLPKGQRKRQLKHQNQSARSRNDQSLENGSFIYVNNVAELVPQQKQVSDSDTYRYLWSDTLHMSSEDSIALNHTSIHPTLSAVKLENSSLNALSTKDSDMLNKSQSKEDCHAPSFQGTSIGSMENRKKLHEQQGFQASFESNPFESNPKNVGMPVQASTSDTDSMENLVYFSGDNLKSYTEIGGVDMAILGKVGSSVAQETSSTNSGIDDISREEASVRQLQLVLEQLDLRTKLCIRDSLYRLAQSAEQRHQHIPPSSSHGDDRGTDGVLFAEGTNKYIGFLDMETQTNPIDRSMAHLLYHRPSGSSAVAGHESVF